MARPEYMSIPYKSFPKDMVKKYNLDDLVEKDGYVYIKIKKKE